MKEDAFFMTRTRSVSASYPPRSIPISRIPRSIIVDALMYPSQDDRFPRERRVIARLKAAGFIRPKGNVAYKAKQAFSWGGKRFVVSCDVCDAFLISFIGTAVLRVPGWRRENMANPFLSRFPSMSRKLRQYDEFFRIFCSFRCLLVFPRGCEGIN